LPEVRVDQLTRCAQFVDIFSLRVLLDERGEATRYLGQFRVDDGVQLGTALGMTLRNIGGDRFHRRCGGGDARASHGFDIGVGSKIGQGCGTEGDDFAFALVGEWFPGGGQHRLEVSTDGGREQGEGFGVNIGGASFCRSSGTEGDFLGDLGTYAAH
jgi:hypothetical protein